MDIGTNVFTEDIFSVNDNWLFFSKNKINRVSINKSKKHIDFWFDNGELLKDKKVLEIGCNSGIQSLNIIRYCKNLITIDSRKECTKAAKYLLNKYKNDQDVVFQSNKWKIRNLDIEKSNNNSKFIFLLNINLILNIISL